MAGRFDPLGMMCWLEMVKKEEEAKLAQIKQSNEEKQKGIRDKRIIK